MLIAKMSMAKTLDGKNVGWKKCLIAKMLITKMSNSKNVIAKMPMAKMSESSIYDWPTIHM